MIPKHVPMVPVTSSNISHIGYDPVDNTLYVKFNSGSQHQYKGVDRKKYAQLVNAKSKGSFFHKNIRDHHKSSPV